MTTYTTCRTTIIVNDMLVVLICVYSLTLHPHLFYPPALCFCCGLLLVASRIEFVGGASLASCRKEEAEGGLQCQKGPILLKKQRKEGEEVVDGRGKCDSWGKSGRI